MSKPAPNTPINPAHPLSAALAIALPLNEGSGNASDAVTGADGLLLAGAAWTSGGVVRDNSNAIIAGTVGAEDGIAFGPAGNTSSVAFPGLSGVFANSTLPCTWTARWIAHSASAGGSLFGQWGGSGPDQQVFYVYQQGRTVVLAVTNATRNVGLVAVATGPELIVGAQTTLTVVWSGPATFDAYVDGVAIGPISYPAPGPVAMLNNAPSSIVEIGAASGSNYTADVTIVAAYAHKRALSAAEAASLHADPYQMFATPAPTSSLLLRRRRSA